MEIKTAKRIGDLMREENLTQQRLARAIGVGQSTISEWLNAKKEPCIPSLWLLADYFGTTIDFIVGRQEH